LSAPLRLGQNGATLATSKRLRAVAPMPGSPPQARWTPGRMPPSHCIGKTFSDSAGGSTGRFASPPQVVFHFGETNPRCKSATIDGAYHGPLQQGSAYRSPHTKAATKNPARCPARVCRMVLNSVLTIRDSGNASQDKTRPRLFGWAFARADPVAPPLRHDLRLAWRDCDRPPPSIPAPHPRIDWARFPP
jgi:hypothetical protein